MTERHFDRQGFRLISRRTMLRAGIGSVAAGLLAACGGGATTPTTSSAKPSATGTTSTGAAAGTTTTSSTASPSVRVASPSASPIGSPVTSGQNQAELNQLYEAAKKEGKVVWWTAHYAQEVADAVAAAFKTKYPGIDVEYIRQTAQVIYQRLTQDIKSGVKELDVFASTDEAHYADLKKQNQLMAYAPVGFNQLPADLQHVDPDNMYFVGALGFVLINYNTDKVQTPPAKWTDLTDPKWNNQITLGHPGFSGYVGNWVVAMNDKYGWDYFTKLAKNNPKIGRSVNDTVTDEVSGERSVGAGPDNYSLQKKSQGNPIDIRFPDDDAILIVSPVGIMKDAPHPNAAKLFESFFYSPEYSQTMAQTYNYPLLPSVPPPSGKPISQVKWYRNKVDRLSAGVPEVVAKWRDTFGV